MRKTVILAASVALGLAGCNSVFPGQPGGQGNGVVVPPAAGVPDFEVQGHDARGARRRPAGVGVRAFVPGRFILRARDRQSTVGAARAAGGSIAEEDTERGVALVAIPPDANVDAAVAAASRERGVDWAEPDYLVYAADTIPNDPLYNAPDRKQWGLPKIQAPAAWDFGKGDPSVKIAILDTGIDQNHEDLAAKIRDKTRDQVNLSGSPTLDDLYGHGSHVAGIAAAITNNRKGVAGLGWSASLMNVKVLNDVGVGSIYNVGLGIAWAVARGAKVINLSLGSLYGSQFLESQINYAAARNVVVVAAAGNNGDTRPFYPAAYVNAIAVAASDSRDAKASFSSFGASWVDVAAPGVSILSTLPNHPYLLALFGYPFHYGSLSGTSMATPFVAGQAALLAAKYPGWSRTAIRNRIETTCDRISGTGTSPWSYYRYGRINVGRAMANP